MQYKRSKQLQKVFLLLLVSGLILYLIRKKKADMSVLKVIRESKFKELEPYILAQSKHETANWKSPLFRRGKNLFGMKKARRRKQLGFEGDVSPEGDKYQYYNSYAESMKDFILYLEAVRFPVRVESVEQYARELFKRDYFTDNFDNYLRGLKRWIK